MLASTRPGLPSESEARRPKRRVDRFGQDLASELSALREDLDVEEVPHASARRARWISALSIT